MERKKLIQKQKSEISQPFSLVKQLFAFAVKKGFEGSSYDEYGNEEGGENRYAIPLPPEFSSLVSKYPGSYFIVAYADRTDPYYREGTREKAVRLSTVKTRAETELKIREIDLVQMDPSFGNRIQVRVSESIKNKSFSQLNRARGLELEEPSGRVRYTSEIQQDGKETDIELSFNRLDEGLFVWRGVERPVRLLRNLVIKKVPIPEIVYEEHYIVGRQQEHGRDERAQIKMRMSGSIDEPSSILIEIGLFSPGCNVLYDDPARKIRVVHYHAIGAYTAEKEILKQDPVIKDLFSGTVDIEKITQALKTKITLLRDEWDKPKNIFFDDSQQLPSDRDRRLSP